MSSRYRLIPALISCFVIAAVSLQAQLIVAPTSVFIEKNQPIATVILVNQTSDVREVDLQMRFAYPDLDSSGTMFINYEPREEKGVYSLIKWTKVFPRRMTLAPGERQNVRIMVRPPAGLPDGAFWGRLMVVSRTNVELQTEGTQQVGAQLDFSIAQVVPVLFKHDAPTPQLSLGDHKVDFEDDKVILSHAISCELHPPFYGSATCTLKNSSGEVVRSITAPAAVFFDNVKQFAFERDQLLPGLYTVDFELSPQREGLEDRFVIAMDPLSTSWTFQLNSGIDRN